MKRVDICLYTECEKGKGRRKNAGDQCVDETILRDVQYGL